jgi:hypothetical protein
LSVNENAPADLVDFYGAGRHQLIAERAADRIGMAKAGDGVSSALDRRDWGLGSH